LLATAGDRGFNSRVMVTLLPLQDFQPRTREM